MRGKVYTYMASKVIAAFGNHEITGFAPDSFITIEKNGDGTTYEQGVDGEGTRSIDPNTSYKIKFSLQQMSTTHKFLEETYFRDQETGEAILPILMKDITGKTVFQADQAWITKLPSYAYGKAAGNREWELEASNGTIS